jgi:hypothetical protein
MTEMLAIAGRVIGAVLRALAELGVAAFPNQSVEQSRVNASTDEHQSRPE